MLFSERYGYTKPKELIQIELVDNDLRNGLWDALKIFYFDLYNNRDHKKIDDLIIVIWHSYLKKPIDTIPSSFNDTYYHLREYFYNCEWYEVYSFIEFIASNYSCDSNCNIKINSEFREFCNTILERENSGYRFVDEYITRITSDVEIESIETALGVDDKFKSVHIHLKTSLRLMSDKKNPDFRNSIKESISAVEALCKIITKDEKATLGKALKLIDKKYNVHSALIGAFEKLYGYTSDSNGIRHSMQEEAKLSYQDALYMLVSCSAFTNYLIDKID